MAPVRSYYNWNQRKSNNSETIEPYRKYFFICEGANTETRYFKALIDNKKDLGIKPTIDIRLLEKTDEDKNLSFPKKLIEFAEKQKKNSEISFNNKTDKMIIIFDADIFENKVSDLEDLIALSEKNNVLGISNPSFELFLLMHYPDAYKKYIEPHADEILANNKVGSQRYICALFSSVSHMNPKKNLEIGSLAKDFEYAILEEKNINEDIHCCKGKITCNIAKIIDDIRNNRDI